MDRRLLRHADFLLLACVLVLCAWGALAVYSASSGRHAVAGLDPARKLKLQVLWIALGLVVMAVVSCVDYQRLARVHWAVYVAAAVLLVVVPFAGTDVGGAKRWIEMGPVRLQPAEFAKLAIILTLAAVLAPREEQRSTGELVIGTLALAMAPMALVFLQPDLGTPVIAGFIWLSVMYLHGSKVRHLAVVVLIGVVLFGAMWGFGVLQPHQKQRLTAFLHPEADPRDAGYHIIMARTAIGAGGLTGQGFRKGGTTQNQFIPDQDTDFIFTVVGEELGFVGGVVLLALYFVLLYRSLQIAVVAKDQLGRLIAGGVTAMLFFHVFVNVGMTLGLMPVKGLPLPFLSYGGSSMIVNMVCIGLLESVHMRRHKITF